MNVKRIVAIVCIFLLGCGGWWILGAATAIRSSGFHSRLGSEVKTLWGAPLVQQAPSLSVQIPGTENVRWIMPSKNDITVGLLTDYRKKGLIWYPTYVCSFDGTYGVTNEEDVKQKINLYYSFPAKGATYDNFSISVDGKALQVPVDTNAGIGEIMELAPGESKQFRITYKTRGIREWRYQLDRNVGRVQNLNLVVRTDFRNIDYPKGSMSAMAAQDTKKGMTLTWSATDLITNEAMGVIIPEKLNPGPLTTRITFFAPVCLLFFFVLVATIHILYRITIHPMHYLFVAAGFFAFHFLLAYMAGLVNIHVAFVIAAVVSVTLVTSYLAAALGGKFPWKVAISGQLFFLVLFSYSFFLKGITGLTIAIGSVVTLAILMKATVNVDWNRVFAKAERTGSQAPPPMVPPIPNGGH
jgi:hypothetical protein